MTDSILIHSYKIPVKGVKKKIIYHFSDTHITEYDALSDENERLCAIEDTREWEGLRLGFARDHGASWDERQLVSAGEHLRNLLSAAGDGDAVVLAGDICDNMSGANLRFLNSAFGELSVPFMAVCGNHERAEEFPDGMHFSGMKKPVQVADLGDVILFGIDNARRQISAEQNRALLDTLALGKPVIVVMHVPVRTEGNAEKFEKCGEYFQLNHSKASAEVREFIDIIKENSGKIAAVLAGHLHFADNSEIAPGVMQYVSDQGILGNLNRYVIGE